MTNAKHTPGPWKYIDATKVAGMQFAPACVIQSGDKNIARFSWNDNSPWFPTKEESQANARLIAAAPELLEALKGLLADIEDYQRVNNLGGENNHWQVISRAAIAKAEGR